MTKWKVIRKGNGKYYPRVSVDFMDDYWPWNHEEFDTLEEAKSVLIAKKAELERMEKEWEETLVFEL